MKNRKRKFNRKKATQQLGKRVTESYNSREDTGKFRDYFDAGAMDGLSKWKVPKGEFLMDIIPFMTGAQHPKLEEDQVAYYLDLFIHMNVGPGDDQYVCPANFGRNCPICEERQRRSEAGEDYENRIKPLSQKRRAIYNVVVLDGGKEEAKGVQILEIAHWFMESKLVQIAKDPRTGAMQHYGSDTAEGKSVAFGRTGTGKTSTNYEGHRLVDRDYEISDALLEQAACLDELISIPSYDELATAFFGADEPGDTQEEVEYSEGAEEEAFEEVVEDEEVETPVAKPKPKAKPKAKAKALVCPVGLDPAESFDLYEDCDACKQRKACEASSQVAF